MYIYIYIYTLYVVVYTDLSYKVSNKQAAINWEIASGSLGSEIVNTPTRTVRSVGLIPALGKIVPIFHRPYDTICNRK